MIQHTLVFSFGDGRSAAEIDVFMAQIKRICLESGLTTQMDTALHHPAPEDQYAPVFVSSAIAQLVCADMATLNKLSAHEPLTSFEMAEQKKAPYQLVWVNSDVLDLG